MFGLMLMIYVALGVLLGVAAMKTIKWCWKRIQNLINNQNASIILQNECHGRMEPSSESLAMQSVVIEEPMDEMDEQRLQELLNQIQSEGIHKMNQSKRKILCKIMEIIKHQSDNKEEKEEEEKKDMEDKNICPGKGGSSGDDNDVNGQNMKGFIDNNKKQAFSADNNYNPIVYAYYPQHIDNNPSLPQEEGGNNLLFAQNMYQDPFLNRDQDSMPNMYYGPRSQSPSVYDDAYNNYISMYDVYGDRSKYEDDASKKDKENDAQ